MQPLEGVTGAPYKTPSVRKVMPPPFQRLRIEVGGTAKQRRWQDTHVVKVNIGDTVVNVGVVSLVEEFVDVPNHVNAIPVWRVRLHNVLGEHFDFPGESRVFAFTPDPPGDTA